MPRNPATLLDLMSVEVANLLADAAHTPFVAIDLSDEKDERSNGTDEILRRAQTVDASLESWPETLPLHWHPTRMSKDTIPEEVIDAGLYQDSCEIYPDVMICSTWNEWRVIRLKVLGLVAELGLVNGIGIGAQINNEIRQLVDGICASVPFCLGSRTMSTPLYQAEVVYPGIEGRLNTKEHQKTASAYGGWYLFSPLKQVMQVRSFISNHQHEWARYQLLRLARIHDVQPS